MKKSRNSYFNDYEGYQNVPINGPMPPMYGPINNDINERLAKIERSLNRLEHRITNLENKLTKSVDDFDDNENMYMI